ncbi:PREDICTED: WD repeat-containing protein 7-like [Amphimedon queenslandica]|nr:PREDICTED: WD repeat-containing protein 7-like [Amphimedon queenslandica]|eukprot:XP_019855598.1 PREDICTED: WD repeat-containing protein 7-like [Amphimedon queenslandica]
MEKVVSKPRPVSDVTPHARAFRRYISARKNFNVSEISPSIQRKSGQPDASHASPREQAKALEKIGDAVAGVKSEVIKPEPPDTTINTARLLVSCLHAWNLDNTLDKECEDTLGLVRPSCPVSFGLTSKGGALSLVLPGWGLVKESPAPVHNNPGVAVDDLLLLNQLSETQSAINATLSVHKERSLTVPVSLEEEEGRREEEKDINEEGIQSELLNHVRWQLSRSLTTQHLLTVVSITNTLMNQTWGAHMLATGSGVNRRLASESTESDDGSSDEDDHTLRDNLIRGTWSKVAALHCVMLPERMADYFRPPHLPVLASRFMDPTQAIREAAQALLQSELRRVGVKGRLQLVSHWSSKLHSPSSFKTTHDHRPKSHDEPDYYDVGVTQATPTQQQQMTALVILGMIGAEFNIETKRTPQLQKQAKKSSRKKVESMPPGASASDEFEVLDPQVARQTAKTLEAVLLDRPLQKSSLYSPLRCSAAELMGRGFHLWEKYVNVPSVVMGLLDLSVLPHITATVTSPTGAAPGTLDEKASKKMRAAKFLAETAKRALNLMVLLRPTTVVTAIAKELSLFLGSQHGTPFPHPSLPPLQVGQTPPPNTNGIVSQASVLLPAAKEEMFELVRTILDKCSGHVSSQILDVADIALYCLDQDELKRKNFNDLFPSLTRLPNVSYSLRTKRLAVGAGSGQIGIYDLKQRKTQMINAHSHQVIVLSFSEEGKYLATYSYGDSMLKVWQISTSILSGVINSAPKCIHNWPAISNTTTATNYNYVRIEWTSNKSVVLHMPGGIEYKYSL